MVITLPTFFNTCFSKTHHISRWISPKLFFKELIGKLAFAQNRWQTHRHIQTDLNSMAPGRFQFNFRKVIFKLILVNGGWGLSNDIALRWTPLDLTDDKSPLVQVMAWCRQATSHYLSQCWPRSLSSYGVTRPQWVNWPSDAIIIWWHISPSKLVYIRACLTAPSHYLN